VNEPDRDGVEEVQLLAAALAGLDQARLLQHPQMLHHTEACHRQSPLELAQGLSVALEERVEQATASGIGKRLEHLVHGLDYR